MNLCIIQARLASTRLPSKVLKKVNNTPLLEYQIKRIKQVKLIDKIVIATGVDKSNDRLVAFCRKIKIPIFRGLEDDVLDRFYQCALSYPNYKNIIRITGDCPLIDPAVIDQVIELFHASQADYGSNVNPPTYPDGMDVEIFTRESLIHAWENAKLTSEREHVTLYIRNQNNLKQVNLHSPYDFSHFRLTVDNPEDFEVIKFLIQHSKITASYLDYISLLTKNPKVMFKNAHIQRNEGLIKSLKKDFN